MGRFLRKTRVLSKLGMSVLHAKLLRKRRPIFVGLYITNKLIELLEGEIKISSPGQDCGTLVCLTIPVEK